MPRSRTPSVYARGGRVQRSLVLLTALLFSTACEPDAHDVEGAIARAVSAASGHDEAGPLHALDQRERFAMAALVKARTQAAGVIRTGYPKEAQAAALAELGDALQVESGPALFGLRCPDACMDELASRLSSPRAVQHEGRLARVETVRGEKLELYKADDGTYGLLWHSDAARRENSRAFAELISSRKTLTCTPSSAPCSEMSSRKASPKNSPKCCVASAPRSDSPSTRSAHGR